MERINSLAQAAKAMKRITFFEKDEKSGGQKASAFIFSDQIDR
jgi:hypothetical protein